MSVTRASSLTAEGRGTLPRHIAIIMDGNGRWAKQRGRPRSFGHHSGMEALRKIVSHAAKRHIDYLTLFAFSSENWSRPADEVSDLLSLLRRFIKKELAELHRENVRLKFIGAPDNLPKDILALLEDAKALTASNSGLTLVIALNYGSRQEIAQAAKTLAEKAVRGDISPSQITPAFFAAQLFTVDIPDPDLVIRTSGEKRISNFLLWQLAYAEMLFTPVLWPDFDENCFDQALDDYANRERRYGGLAAARVQS